MPKTNKPYLLVSITNQTQNDLTKTESIVKQIQDFIMEQPESETVLSGIGICVPRYNFSVIDRGETDANGDICVKLNLKNGGRFKNTWEIVNYVQDWIDANVSGADVVVDELGIIPSTEPPVSVYVKGDDIESLNTVSTQAADILKNIDGIKGVSNDSHYSTYGYYVNIDDNKRNSLGLTNSEIQNELNIAISGRTASVFYQNGKQYDINVSTELDSTDDLSNYAIKSSSGNKYMVKQFADIGLNPEANTIKHVNGVRGAIVGGYVKNGYGANSLQTEFEKKLEKLDVPEGISFEYKGEKNMGSEAMTTIGIASMISIVVIFLILYLQYARFRQVFLLFSSVPMGAVAGIAALVIFGMNVSFFAMLGILSMLGIVLANAIVLVDFINTERANGAAVDDACRIAGEKRLRPILMSTMTTVLGFLPLALSGQTLFVGMAVLLMAALTVCMVFNLIMVPTIYSMIERDDNNDKKKKRNSRGINLERVKLPGVRGGKSNKDINTGDRDSSAEPILN
jgi:multidrug efflux pump subunit AcrB